MLTPNFGHRNKWQKASPTGNWTPVSRVTGGDTHHYTTEDEMSLQLIKLENFDQLHFDID